MRGNRVQIKHHVDDKSRGHFRFPQTFFFYSFLLLPSYWSMMSTHPVTQSSQPITTKGMGRHFTSPRKAPDKKKSWTTALLLPGHASKRQKLLEELDMADTSTLLGRSIYCDSSADQLAQELDPRLPEWVPQQCQCRN